MTTTYNLRDFSDIKYRNRCFLSEEEMKNINDIADILNIYINPPSSEKSSDDFKPTPIKQKNENPDNIRKYLNKITEKNYNKYEEMIINNIKNIKNETELQNIGRLIFTIASSNSFNSSVYAKLCKNIITSCGIMKINIENNFEQFIDLFDEIQYSDPNVDYEKFCENNKQNSLRRSLCTFYINLMKEEVLDIQKIKTLLFKLIDKFNDTVKSEKNGFICEEIVENLFILITEGKEILKNTDDWNDIYEFINNRKSLQVVNNPSFTNKIKFKLMDIYDIII
tara:strand:+ start:1654 stop:2496 length:843 start_codon:yes stop_codon:yes gene_type:complete